MRPKPFDQSLLGQSVDRPPAASRQRFTPETLPEIVEHLGANLGMVLFDVLDPKGMLDLAIERGLNIELGQLGFASDSIAGQDRGEDSGRIDQMTLQVL